jgi:hypothetical protein
VTQSSPVKVGRFASDHRGPGLPSPNGAVCGPRRRGPRWFARERRFGAFGSRASFPTERAPEGIGLDDLTILGPILVLKVKFNPEGHDRRLVAELWMYPDLSMLLELSTRCATTEAFRMGIELRLFQTDRSIDLTGEQETKTKKALKFFSQRLQAADVRFHSAMASADLSPCEPSVLMLLSV